MAHVDQGAFHRFRERYRELTAEYDEQMREYSLEPTDREGLFNGLAAFSDNLFNDLEGLEKELSGMLESVEFKDERKREKYKEMEEGCRSMADNLQCSFKERRDLMAFGVGLDGYEKQAVDSLRINL